MKEHIVIYNLWQYTSKIDVYQRSIFHHMCGKVCSMVYLLIMRTTS